MIYAQIHETCIVVEYIYPIRSNLAEFFDEKIVIKNFTRKSSQAPFFSIVFEFSDFFLFVDMAARPSGGGRK